MVLDVLGAAVLIALGIVAIYFSVEGGIKDRELTVILFLGILAVAGGLWIIIAKLTLMLILKKLAGLILAGIGLFLVIGFPDLMYYQSFSIGRSAILIGLVMLIFGLYLLLF